MAIIQGYWDCPYCGNEGIPGKEQTCPSCGKTRSAETKFYMKEKTPVADESKVEKGPDWFCPYCDSYNSHSATHCKNCGHEREATDQDYFAKREEQAQKQEKQAADRERVISGSQPRQKRSPKRLISILLILALIIGGISLLTAPRDRGVTVTDRFWERSVEVEEYRLVEESDWILPADAVELLRTEREIHHYDSVLDHYETVTETRSREVLDGYDTYTTYNDMGNGYFETEEHSVPRYRTEYYTETYEEPVYVQVPVFETKYYYTAQRWVYDRTETVSGSGAGDAYWPDIPFGDTLRQGQTQESYSVACEAKGKQYTYTCDYPIWSSMEIGRSYTVRVDSGRILELK